MATYPKNVTLKDGSGVMIRYLRPSDFNNLLAFFRSLPAEDRQFLRRDCTDPEIVRGIVAESERDNTLWLVAEKDGQVIAECNVTHPQCGWMRHVGDMRVVVAREYQRQGLGSIMYRELFIGAVGLKIEKVTGCFAGEQESARRCMAKLGFREEVVLPNHIIDLAGGFHDMVVMGLEI